MLLLKNRLKKGKDFNLAYKKGKSVFEEDLFIKFFRNGLTESRIGFSVGIKLSPKAVVRNKLKRQLRAVIRENMSKIKEGFDIIIIPQPIFVKKSYDEVKKSTEKALFKGNLINNLKNAIK